MAREVYRYVFNESVPFAEVLATVDLSLIAVESIHGESRSRLDARFGEDAAKRSLVIDAGTTVGQALNQVFVGYARLEFGETAFRVERLNRVPESEAAVGGSG